MTAVPRVVVSAPSSGHGKTAVAVGLLAAVAARGIPVAGFKIGPDHADAAYLGLESGRHRAREERSSAVQLELAAFGPFIEPLSPEQREEERVIMTRKLFPSPDGSAAPVSRALRRPQKDTGLDEVAEGWDLGSTPTSAPAEPERAPAANGAASNGSPL